MSTTAFPKVLIIKEDDNVAVALEDLARSQFVPYQDKLITLLSDISFGHKFAVRSIEEGGYVVKYGAKIGIATRSIEIGEHVHVHNVRDIVDEVRREGRKTHDRRTA